MEGNNNKSLIQLSDQMLLNWGADVWGEYATEELGNSKNISLKNRSIAFVEIPHEDKDTEFEQKFNKALKKFSEIDKEIASPLREQHHMNVGHIGTKYVELIPQEERDQHFQYILTIEYYDAGHDWFPLETGDELYVHFHERKSTRVSCKVNRVKKKANGHRLITVGSQADRLAHDLNCMGGNALIQANVVNSEVVTNPKHLTQETLLTMRLGNIQLKGKHSLFFCCPHINGKNTKVGSQYAMWVVKSFKEDVADSYFLTFTKRSNEKYPQPPKDIIKEEYMAVVGRIYEIKKNSDNLLWIEVDGTWSSCVFRNNINLNVWGELIRDFLPMGFPAQFLLHTANAKNDNEEDKDRFLFMGMNPSLKGRVKSDAEAKDMQNRLLCERVLVSPHRLDGKNERILVTSPYYAGYATFNNIPEALLRYCEKGIFTTEMQVPATVRMHKNTVYFNINYALQKELDRISSLNGETEKMKICSIHLGTAYLTTQGGYPIEYVCKNEEEEKLIRSKMFQTHDFTFEIDNEQGIRVRMEEDYAEKLAKVDIPLGGFFFAKNVQKDNGGTWHTMLNDVDCVIIPESTCGKDIRENDRLMLVSMTSRHLIAAANPRMFVDTLTESRRIETIRTLNPEIWLCRDGERLVLMHCTKPQTFLLRHLQNLYGTDIPVDVDALNAPVEGAESAKCRFNGIACGANYSRLFSGQVMELQLPISEQAPRVLFNDVVLVLDEDPKEPVQWVTPTGIVSADGTMRCKVAHAPKRNSHHGKDHKIRHQEIKGSVIRCNEDEVIFMVGDNEIAIKSENLGTPYLENIGINEIFTEGSEWLLEETDGILHVSNRCPEDICKCTLIAEYQRVTQFERGRGRRRYTTIKWIVKNSLGAIAVTEQESGQAGDSLLLVHEGDDMDGIPYVVEPDLIGRKIALTLESAGTTGMECRSIDGLAITNEYSINYNLWNWFSSIRPYVNVTPLLNASFMAKIKDFDMTTGGVVFDRRSTLEQCALRSETQVSGTYQMKVAGLNNDGYLLRQNDVSAVLPWNEVSVCDIPQDEDIRWDFLKQGTLLEVELIHDDSSGKLSAKWRSNLAETYSRWKEYIQNEQTMNAIVHHITDSGLYLDVEGEYMFVTAKEARLWEGDTMKDYFHPGQYLRDCILHYDKAKNVFSISLDDRYTMTEIPQIGTAHTATVLKYNDGDRIDCIVKFGRFTAIVPETKWVCRPLKPGERPFAVGDEVKVTIEEVHTDDRKIYASIIGHDHTSDFESGYRFFQFCSMDEEGNILLADSEMIPAVLYASDYSLEPETLSAKIKTEHGIWLPIIKVTDYKGRLMHECSYGMIQKSNEKIKADLEENGGRFKAEVTVIVVKMNRLTVRYGDAIGIIQQNQITGQILFPLKEAYHAGDRIECVINGFKETTGQFTASVVDLYPNGFRDIVKDIAIDDQMKVLVCTNSNKGVRVKIVRKNISLYGMVPHDEIRTDAEAWCTKWKDDYVLVKCIGIDYETGYIYFSRKQVLAEGVED
jgi:ribosomal protein S1